LYTDVTAIRAAEKHVRYRAYFDVLTELPNRENFIAQLETAVRQSRRDGSTFALLFIDLDRFKNVNDTLGHSLGDSLLREAAHRLANCVRQSDTLARFGGDEFTLILRDMEDGLNAAQCAETIIERLSEPYRLGGHIAHAGASVGITLYPADAEDAAGLLRNADLAMYQAKDHGRSTFRFFASEMTTRAEQFVMLEKDLRLALGREEFVFEFQPVVRLCDGNLAGAEALMRWRHPVRGQVYPGEFIGVAEETRLIADLGSWALRKVCATAAPWCTGGGVLPRLSVNVSGRQLTSGFDQHYVRRVLDESGFPPECLIFEMTESLLIEHDTHVVGVLSAFRDLGIGIAIDDFGTGYSALGYLRRFPVTMLKIDRSFIADVETTDSHLVEAIVALGRGLGLVVVAEGVESARQADILAGMGCELAQGFHFSRPLPGAAFAAWYGQNRARSEA
jgi:diguanylate cyclase (GGDEF)-like protein